MNRKKTTIVKEIRGRQTTGSPLIRGFKIDGRVSKEALHGSVRPSQEISSWLVATLRTDLMTGYSSRLNHTSIRGDESLGLEGNRKSDRRTGSARSFLQGSIQFFLSLFFVSPTSIFYSTLEFNFVIRLLIQDSIHSSLAYSIEIRK